MDERLRFIQDAQSDRWTMVALCERSGISCRIGYKWLARYAEEGRRGLVDRSRRPHHSPQRMRSVLEELLCEFRRTHPARWTALLPMSPAVQCTDADLLLS